MAPWAAALGQAASHTSMPPPFSWHTKSASMLERKVKIKHREAGISRAELIPEASGGFSGTPDPSEPHLHSGTWGFFFLYGWALQLFSSGKTICLDSSEALAGVQSQAHCHGPAA